MMLYTFAWGETIIWVLIALLIVFLLALGYKLLLKNFSKGMPSMEEYCVLHPLEDEISKGEIEFYFTIEKPMKVRLVILDAEMKELLSVADDEFGLGGNIVRFDTTALSNGVYFYCILTENQKTMKKMKVVNG